jgi:hypothetical protein
MRALVALVSVLTACATFTDADYRVVEDDENVDAGLGGSGTGDGALIDASAAGAGDTTDSEASTGDGDGTDPDSSPSTGGGAGTGTSNGTTGSDEGLVLDPNELACGDSFPPTDIECPDVCNGGCSAGTCNIQCDNDSPCKNAALTCPPGLNCVVVCAGRARCEEANIACADGYACSVTCASQESCKEASVVCGVQGGSCNLSCQDAKACEQTRLLCGAGECNLGCTELEKFPTVACGNACDCQAANCGPDEEDND